MFRTKPTLSLLASLAAGACSEPDESATRDSVTDSVPRPTTVAIVEFDPAATHAGDMVMGLTVDSIATQRAQTGETVGMARFSGVLVLSGQTFRHPDADYAFPCFEADSASARTLPRWAGDTRRPWFCFENREEAKQQFGGADAGRPATIRIDRFTIHKNLSDAVNSARLIGIVSRSDSTAVLASRCYSTAGSVLGRAPGTAAPAPRDVVGWLRLDDSSATADSGLARLVDSDGRSLMGTWRRIGGDSLTIVAFDDFVRVEMRLLATRERLAGSATATSDAATTRDSAGRMSPFRRRWTIGATNQTCASMPD